MSTQIEVFKEQITSVKAQNGLASQIPEDVDITRFTAVIIRAVQEDPALLDADRRTLMLSCQRAAQDGLIPDKREGALVVYNTKVNGQWVKAVQWQPMIGGIRRLLANHGFDLRAELVHENDAFEMELGDNPSLSHKPPQLGSPRGKVIGAYAVATGPDGRKYREVMDIDQLEFIRSLSNSSGGPWAKFEGEMYRKTVAKRLFKALPMPNADRRLQGMIDRDNEQFELSSESSSKAKSIQQDVRQGTQSAVSKLPKPASMAQPVAAKEPDPEPVPEPKKKKADEPKAKNKVEPKADEPTEEEVPNDTPAKGSEAIEGELVDNEDLF